MSLRISKGVVGLNFIKKCQGCPEKVFLQCLQGVTGGEKIVNTEAGFTENKNFHEYPSAKVIVSVEVPDG